MTILSLVRSASQLSSFLGSHESVLVMFSSLSSSPGNADSSGDLGMTCGAGQAGIQGQALSPSSPSTFHFHQHVLDTIYYQCHKLLKKCPQFLHPCFYLRMSLLQVSNCLVALIEADFFFCPHRSHQLVPQPPPNPCFH